MKVIPAFAGGANPKWTLHDPQDRFRREEGLIKRIAMLCDVHGNLHALGAVLEDVDRADVDLVVFGGDVAAGPMPVETIEELARYSKPVRFIRGNADRFMVEIFDRARESAEPMDTWSAGRLRRVHRDFLGSFEPSLEIELSPLGLVLCCHASPESDELPIITPGTPDEVIAAVLASTPASLVVVGAENVCFVVGASHEQVIDCDVVDPRGPEANIFTGPMA